VGIEEEEAVKDASNCLLMKVIRQSGEGNKYTKRSSCGEGSWEEGLEKRRPSYKGTIV
jgi:hypothetical protein